jgi:hypothetical protein
MKTLMGKARLGKILKGRMRITRCKDMKMKTTWTEIITTSISRLVRSTKLKLNSNRKMKSLITQLDSMRLRRLIKKSLKRSHPFHLCMAKSSIPIQRSKASIIWETQAQQQDSLCNTATTLLSKRAESLPASTLPFSPKRYLMLLLKPLFKHLLVLSWSSLNRMFLSYPSWRRFLLFRSTLDSISKRIKITLTVRINSLGTQQFRNLMRSL